jgi:ubiquitin-large subunit ribosomal protein L40e
MESFIVKLPDGELLNLNLASSTTLLQVKQQIENQFGIPVQEQRLFDPYIAENDAATLSTFQISAGQVFELRRCTAPPPATNADKMTFTIKTLSGKTMLVQVPKNATIGDAKAAVTQLESIPVTEQRLIFKGKQPQDHETLEESGIGQDCTVHLLLRLRS